MEPRRGSQAPKEPLDVGAILGAKGSDSSSDDGVSTAPPSDTSAPRRSFGSQTLKVTKGSNVSQIQKAEFRSQRRPTEELQCSLMIGPTSSDEEAQQKKHSG